MATISSAGIGSGLDVKSIVSQLVAVESRPLTQLQTRGSTLNTKLSNWGTVKSQLAAVQDAAQKLMGLSGWNARTFKSGNEDALTGTATEGATAGSYQVEVQSLAKAQSTRSGGITAGSTLGEGGLLVSIGKWEDDGSFSSSSGVVPIDIAASDTMTDIARKINGSGAGITASVVTSNGQDQLMMRSASTGASMGFQIETYGDAALNALSYPGDGSSGMTRNQAGSDAQVKIDGGMTVTSSSNTLSNVISGLTLDLKQTGTTTVDVTSDTSVVKKSVDDFVSAFNTAITNLTTATKYDAGSKTAGPLQGDATAVGLLNTLKNMVMTNGPTGTSFNRLSDVGLELQRDGTLKVNSGKLTAALAKPDELKTFFAASSDTVTETGMARRFYDYTFNVNSSGGVLTGRNKALQEAISRNNTDIDKMEARISRTEERLYKTYSALDTKMSTLNSMSTYVAQQISAWSNASKNS